MELEKDRQVAKDLWLFPAEISAGAFVIFWRLLLAKTLLVSPISSVLLSRQGLGNISATYESCAEQWLGLHERAAKADCLIVPLIGLGKGETVREQSRFPRWTLLVLRRDKT
eukprot:8112326-Alexandrium_andersonii.AAC.1